MTRDNLRGFKEDLNDERSKRRKLEETLKEKEKEIENLRAGVISPGDGSEKNTTVKILVLDRRPEDKERERRMLEVIKKSLRKMSAKCVSGFEIL